MGLLSRLQILLRNIRRRKNSSRPPTAQEWAELPDFVKTQIFYATFDAMNGWDGEIYIAHWVGW
jgi:hypothetical protein